MKKNSKKKALKRAGFTLVELIVVIVILGILTAVAVPTYTGYITKANNAAALSAFSGVLTAAQSAAAMEGKSVTEITIGSDGYVTAKCGDDAINASDLRTFTSDISTDGKISVSLTNSDYTSGAFWSSTDQEWKPGTTESPAPTAGTGA